MFSGYKYKYFSGSEFFVEYEYEYIILTCSQLAVKSLLHPTILKHKNAKNNNICDNLALFDFLFHVLVNIIHLWHLSQPLALVVDARTREVSFP